MLLLLLLVSSDELQHTTSAAGRPADQCQTVVSTLTPPTGSDSLSLQTVFTLLELLSLLSLVKHLQLLLLGAVARGRRFQELSTQLLIGGQNRLDQSEASNWAKPS